MDPSANPQIYHLPDREVILHLATPEDLPALQTLYVKTIRRTCSIDYKPEQIEAWTASISNKARWLQAIEEQYFLLARIDGQPGGFGSLKNGNYIDFLYVHPDFQGKGIARILFNALEKEALRIGNGALYSDVSITARPFFERKGFEVMHPNRHILSGVEIINFRMVRENK